MKLEVGKTYLDGYDRKIKIIGNDGGIFYGKLLDKSKFYAGRDSIDQFYPDGSQYTIMSAGSKKNQSDLIKEFNRDPIKIEFQTVVLINNGGVSTIIDDSLKLLIDKKVKIIVEEII